MNNRLIATAYHEAGHAVAAWVTNVGVTEITIVRGNGAAGHIVRKYVYLGEDDPGPDWQDWEDLIFKNRLPANLGRQPDSETLRRNAERLAMVALAGDVAQCLYNPRSSRHWQFRNDHDTARKAVRSQIGCFSMRSTDAYLDYLKVCVEEILQDNWILRR